MFISYGREDAQDFARRLALLSQVAIETRNRAFEEANRNEGDTNWGLGCKAHERFCHALTLNPSDVVSSCNVCVVSAWFPRKPKWRTSVRGPGSIRMRARSVRCPPVTGSGADLTLWTPARTGRRIDVR